MKYFCTLFPAGRDIFNINYSNKSFTFISLISLNTGMFFSSLFNYHFPITHKKVMKMRKILIKKI